MPLAQPTPTRRMTVRPISSLCSMHTQTHSHTQTPMRPAPPTHRTGAPHSSFLPQTQIQRATPSAPDVESHSMPRARSLGSGALIYQFANTRRLSLWTPPPLHWLIDAGANMDLKERQCQRVEQTRDDTRCSRPRHCRVAHTPYRVRHHLLRPRNTRCTRAHRRLRPRYR